MPAETTEEHPERNPSLQLRLHTTRGQLRQLRRRVEKLEHRRPQAVRKAVRALEQLGDELEQADVSAPELAARIERVEEEVLDEAKAVALHDRRLRLLHDNAIGHVLELRAT